MLDIHGEDVVSKLDRISSLLLDGAKLTDPKVVSAANDLTEYYCLTNGPHDAFVQNIWEKLVPPEERFERFHRLWGDQTDPRTKERLLENAMEDITRQLHAWQGIPAMPHEEAAPMDVIGTEQGPLCDIRRTLAFSSPTDEFQGRIAAVVFQKTFRDSNFGSDDWIQKVAVATGIPPEDLLRVRSSPVWIFHESGKELDALRSFTAALKFPGWSDAVTKLGYETFRLNHDPSVLVANADDWLNDLIRIQSRCPGFSFRQVETLRPPYDDLASRIWDGDGEYFPALVEGTNRPDVLEKAVSLVQKGAPSAAECATEMAIRSAIQELRSLMESNFSYDSMLSEPITLRRLAMDPAGTVEDLKAVKAHQLPGMFPGQRSVAIWQESESFRKLSAQESNPELRSKIDGMFVTYIEHERKKSMALLAGDSQKVLSTRVQFLADVLKEPPGRAAAFAEFVASNPDVLSVLPAMMSAKTLAKEDPERLQKTLAGFSENFKRNGSEILTTGLSAAAKKGWTSDWTALSETLKAFEELDRRGFAHQEALDALETLLENRTEPWASGPDAIGLVRDYFEMFGAYPLPVLFERFAEVCQATELTENLREVGIRKLSSKPGRANRGNELALLNKYASEYRKGLRTSGSIQLQSPLEVELFAAATRIGSGTWGKGKTVEAFVQAFNRDAELGRIRPLAPVFRESIFTANRVDADSVREFKFSEACTNRYSALQSDIAAVRGMNLADVANEVRDQISQSISERMAAVTSSFESANANALNPQRHIKTQQQLTALRILKEQVNGGGSAEGLLNCLLQSELGSDKAWASQVRRLAMAVAVEHGLDWYQLDLGAPVGRETLGGMVESLLLTREHLTSGMDLDKVAKRRLDYLCDVDALNADLARMSKLSDGTDAYLALPSRGVLGEASGFIADACWTMQSSVLRRFPSLVPVIFYKNPGKPSERIAGATLILPAQTKDGRKALIIRGFNPRQNVVSQMDVESFFENFVEEHLTPIAKDWGADVVMITGGGAGGSQTNRPEINLYLDKKYVSGRKALPVEQSPDILFNGYDIADSCFVVRDFSAGQESAKNG